MNARDKRTQTPECLPLEALANAAAPEPEPERISMVVTPSRPMTPQTTQAPTPMALLQIAMDQGADLDRLERLMLMQERWEANNARKAFNVAFAAFKSEAVRILRTKTITDGPLKGKKQAELGAIISAVSPALSKHGLSLSWKMTKDEQNWIEVTCYLSHEDGHSETNTMGGAPDTGPGRNAIQARGSAKTYLERYTATGILGLAPEDDDDGRGGQGAGDVVDMPEAIFQANMKAIREARTDTELKTAYLTAQRACHKNDTETLKAFTNVKNERYRELHATRPGGAQ